MKRLVVGVSLAVVLLWTIGSAQGAKKESTIYGEVIDVVSYVTSGMKPDNADRKAVAEANARAGKPLGILQRGTGRVYIVVMQQSDSATVATLAPYFGLRIFAQGRVYKRGGIQLLMLSDIGKSVK